jgi:hypothetical protein
VERVIGNYNNEVPTGDYILVAEIGIEDGNFGEELKGDTEGLRNAVESHYSLILGLDNPEDSWTTVSIETESGEETQTVQFRFVLTDAETDQICGHLNLTGLGEEQQANAKSILDELSWNIEEEGEKHIHGKLDGINTTAFLSVIERILREVYDATADEIAITDRISVSHSNINLNQFYADKTYTKALIIFHVVGAALWIGLLLYSGLLSLSSVFSFEAFGYFVAAASIAGALATTIGYYTNPPSEIESELNSPIVGSANYTFMLLASVGTSTGVGWGIHFVSGRLLSTIPLGNPIGISGIAILITLLYFTAWVFSLVWLTGQPEDELQTFVRDQAEANGRYADLQSKYESLQSRAPEDVTLDFDISLYDPQQFEDVENVLAELREAETKLEECAETVEEWNDVYDRYRVLRSSSEMLSEGPPHIDIHFDPSEYNPKQYEAVSHAEATISDAESRVEEIEEELDRWNRADELYRELIDTYESVQSTSPVEIQFDPSNYNLEKYDSAQEAITELEEAEAELQNLAERWQKVNNRYEDLIAEYESIRESAPECATVGFNENQYHPSQYDSPREASEGLDAFEDELQELSGAVEDWNTAVEQYQTLSDRYETVQSSVLVDSSLEFDIESYAPAQYDSATEALQRLKDGEKELTTEQLSVMKQSLTHAEEQVSEAEFKQAEETLAAIGVQLSSADEAASSHDLKSLLAEIDEVSQRQTDIQNTINEKRQERLSDEIDSIRSALDRVKELLTAEQFETARESLDDIESQIKATDEEVAQHNFDDLDQDIEAVQNDYELLKKRIEYGQEISQEVAALSEELDSIETEIANSELDTAETALSEIKHRLETVRDTATKHDIGQYDDLIREMAQSHGEFLNEIEERRKSNPIPETIPGVANVSIDYSALNDEKQIGGGGNADVTKATITTKNGPLTVAIKKPRMAGTLHTDAVERMLAEADTWDKLDGHDHIVGVVDYDSEPFPWIAMEYMDTGHLGERSGELEVPQALWTAIAITKGVRHAHRRGVAHLDLKPENVLFRSVEDAWDVPKVADWGLSKHLLEHSKSIEGLSPQYAAPEQFDEGYGSTDDITDIYQLGAVFYELFTGQPPFEGKPAKAMHKVLHEQPPAPSEVVDVPDKLDDILLTTLAKEKSDRYDNIVYLRDALQDLYEEW